MGGKKRKGNKRGGRKGRQKRGGRRNELGRREEREESCGEGRGMEAYIRGKRRTVRGEREDTNIVRPC